MTIRSLAYASVSLVAAACSGDGELGNACSTGSDCKSGFCMTGACADGEADPDGDGLTNRIELAGALSPYRADTDRDGIPDGEEQAVRRRCAPAGPEAAPPDECGDLPSDCDCDGRPDALESAVADTDLDGVPDQFDPDDGAAFCGPRTVPRRSPPLPDWSPGSGAGTCRVSGAGPVPGRCVAFECAPPPVLSSDEECPSGQERVADACVGDGEPADAGADAAAPGDAATDAGPDAAPDAAPDAGPAGS